MVKNKFLFTGTAKQVTALKYPCTSPHAAAKLYCYAKVN